MPVKYYRKRKSRIRDFTQEEAQINGSKEITQISPKPGKQENTGFPFQML
jgi:hypothetical protein